MRVASAAARGCPLANVVLLQFHGRSMWFHSINQVEDVGLIYNYVERMLQGETDTDVPAELAGRQFQRYLADSLTGVATSGQSGQDGAVVQQIGK